MSRIGKIPVTIPEKVEVKVNGITVDVKGPKGNLSFTFNSNVNIKLQDSSVVINPANETKAAKSMWGTTRTIINNMVVGVSTGFSKSLLFTGVGYKAKVSGKAIELNLGYSHPIIYELPEGVTGLVDKNKITLSGCNKELVGFAAAKIRSFRPPEPYKGKGVRYENEVIIRKAGKTGAKK